MHVTRSSQASSSRGKERRVATTNQLAPNPPPGPAGGSMQEYNQPEKLYMQSINGCGQSVVRFDRDTSQSIVKDSAGLQALTTEVVKYRQSVDGCSESLVKFKNDNGPAMAEISGFMSFVVEKAPAFKESMGIISEAKERYIEVEKLASLSAKENAEREIEVKKLASVSAKENAERDIEVEKLKDLKTEMELRRRQSLLKMDQEELKFSQDKKRALEEEESPSQKNKKNKQQDEDEDEDEEEDFITVRDMAKKHMMDIFAGVPLCDHAEIIKEAGGYASRRYKASTGKKMLSKVYRGGYQVCCYPREEESFVIHTLKWAVGEYKKKKGLSASAGAAQATLSSMWAMGQNAKAS